MKKVLTLFGVVLIISGFTNSALAYDFGTTNSDGVFIYYNITDNGAKTVEVTKGNVVYTNSVVIPETVSYQGNNYTVTSIGNGAFMSCKNLTSVNIPNSVTSINDEAFQYCENLISVNIPEEVTYIGDRSFRQCTSLKSIAIPNSVTTVGQEAFSDCFNLATVTIGDSVTSIGTQAFIQCHSLTSIVIPNLVTFINEETFYGCNSLTSITIGESVTGIDYRAFTNCSNVLEINCAASTPPVCDNYAFLYGPSTTQTIVRVPRGSKEAYRAAAVWKDFNNILDNYGESNSESGSQNSGISEGERVKIDDLYYLLYPSTGTASVTYEIHRSSNNYQYLTSAIIPEKIVYKDVEFTVVELGLRALYKSTASEVVLPPTITVLEGESMFGLPNLKQYKVPETITTIHDNAFMESYIEDLTFPNSLTSIAYGTCAAMPNLTKVTLGPCIKSIGGESFNFTYNIEEIICKATTPPTWDYGRGATFTTDVLRNAILYVPAESLDDYKNATSTWGKFANIQPLQIEEEPGEEPEEALQGEADGYGWINLGLPSGTKWATCNIGAQNPGDLGNYYTWGETFTRPSYMYSSCKWYNVSKTSLESQNVIDENGVLTQEYDAATVNWSLSWRMPTKEEMEELLQYCEVTAETQDNHKGYKFTGPNGESIFMPFAGVPMGSSVVDINKSGFYWSSTVSDDATKSWGAQISKQNIEEISRGSGISIRPVLVGKSSPNDPADINNNGKIDTSDIAALVNLVIGLDYAPIMPDINGDDKLDIIDTGILINIILGLK